MHNLTLSYVSFFFLKWQFHWLIQELDNVWKALRTVLSTQKMECYQHNHLFHSLNYYHLCNHGSHIHIYEARSSLYQSVLSLRGTFSLIFQYFTTNGPPLPSVTVLVFSQNFSNLFWLLLHIWWSPPFDKSPTLANFVSNNVYQIYPSSPSLPTKVLCRVLYLWPGLPLQWPPNWLSCL